jgi:hypothetical protein
MNKAEIITELENMVVDRLFGPQPWLADGQTSGTIKDKLIEMGLLEVVCLEPVTWRPTPLGNELDVALFKVFFGTWCKWEVPGILERHGFISRSEERVLYKKIDKGDANSVLIGYVKRAYFEYRKASKFLH